MRPHPVASRTDLSRRRFLGRLATVGGGVVAPHVIPASALGGGGKAPPSERVQLGAIGLNGRGKTDLNHFLTKKDVQCVAVCDCFKKRREEAKRIVDEAQGGDACEAYRFQEEVLGRDDVDAVLLATGTRWHAVLSAIAAEAGKDVYCEKPFSLTIGEGRSLVETTRRYGTVWQCGMQRRSNPSFRSIVEVVRAGGIGRLQRITTFLGGTWGQNGTATPEPAPEPDRFDYDRWLGQAPWAPYSPVRVRLWRMNWNTGGGVVTDMGAHYFDLAQWAHGSEMAGPVEVDGTAEWPDGGFSEVPRRVDARARYEDGVEIHAVNGPPGPEFEKLPGYLQGKAVRFEGEDGYAQIDERGRIRASSAALRERVVGGTAWSHMSDHIRDFVDSVKSRRRTNAYPELAHRGHTIAHLINIALRLGRKVRWDYEAERFVDDAEANRMLSRTRRTPWRI